MPETGSTPRDRPPLPSIDQARVGHDHLRLPRQGRRPAPQQTPVVPVPWIGADDSPFSPAAAVTGSISRTERSDAQNLDAGTWRIDRP